MVSNIPITTVLTDTLSPTATYKIVLMPMALTIPFGIDDTTKGTITIATLDAFDTTIPGGAFRAGHIIAFDLAKYDKLVCLSTNDSLGNILT